MTVFWQYFATDRFLTVFWQLFDRFLKFPGPTLDKSTTYFDTFFQIPIIGGVTDGRWHMVERCVKMFYSVIVLLVEACDHTHASLPCSGHHHMEIERGNPLSQMRSHTHHSPDSFRIHTNDNRQTVPPPQSPIVWAQESVETVLPG